MRSRDAQIALDNLWSEYDAVVVELHMLRRRSLLNADADADVMQRLVQKGRSLAQDLRSSIEELISRDTP